MNKALITIVATLFGVLIALSEPPPQPAHAQGPMPAKEQSVIKRPPPDPQPDQQQHPNLIDELKAKLAAAEQKVAEAKAAEAKAAEQPAPPPPAAKDEITDPQIIVEAPSNRPVGKIIVVRCGRSKNFRRMIVDISPPVPEDDRYVSADGSETVFTVAEEANITLTITASSPDGGLSQVIRTIQVGDPQGGGPAPAAMSRLTTISNKPFDYRRFILKSIQSLPTANRKELAKHLGDAFYVASGDLTNNTGAIRGVPDLFGRTQTYLRASMTDAGLQLAAPLADELYKQLNLDVRSLDDGARLWPLCAAAFKEAAK